MGASRTRSGARTRRRRSRSTTGARSRPTRSSPPAGVLELADDLYDYQLDLIFDDAEETATVSTPQVGKTEATANWAVKQALEEPRSRGWWTAPTYTQVMDGFDACVQVLGSSGLAHVPHRGSKPPWIFIPAVRSIIEFRSWHKPENLSGRTVHWLVVDEAHAVTRMVRLLLEQRMMATLGPRRYIGNATVQGTEWEDICRTAKEVGTFRHWTWEHRYRALVAQGFDREAAAYKARHDRALATWPRSEYDRVYGAKWVVAEETILAPYIDGVFTAEWDKTPHPGHDYIIPVDVGLVDDYTVALPICVTCVRASWYYRERGDSAAPAPGSLGGDTLEDRLAVIGRHWNNGLVVIERNNGQKLLDDTTKVYARTQGWWTDELSKRQAILEWIKLARTGGLTLPNEETIIREHRRFKSVRGKTGNWKFSAPSGEHDDTVMAGVIGIGSLFTGPGAYLRMLQGQLEAKRRRAEEKKNAA